MVKLIKPPRANTHESAQTQSRPTPYLRYNFDVPHAQQVKRAADLVLCANTGGHLYVLAQTGKATAQTVQSHNQTGNNSAGFIMCDTRLHLMPTGGGRA